ncbi:VWA domain-containing protein [bacterium]|nr:VWA domain-containing protein [bacterium]
MRAATVEPGLVVFEDRHVVLQHVSVDAKLHDLLEEVTISQSYKNLDKRNIEAIYTFPLPVDGVLLNFSVKIGERTLQGVVLEKKEAEDQYEEAIVEGDMAIMLEQVGSGLYTANIGNLLPGEEITVTFTYALLHTWTGNTLRFYLPTTVSPRYGDPATSGLEPHQHPEIDLFAENRFSFHMSVTGFVKDAFIESPTHEVVIEKTPMQTDLYLEGRDAMMDRDIIFNFTVESTERNTAFWGYDIDDQYTLLASFSPSFPKKTDTKPRSIKIVVDCSGSMGGDSITQARKAVEMIIDALHPQDYFNIITFGSNYNVLFERQVQANPTHCTVAKKYTANLKADMGGTELENALQAAYSIPGQDNLSENVLLITDGEIWGAEELADRAAIAGHRIFTVGVGSAVSEVTVRHLAEKTGGAVEMVTPNEEMAAKIYRHFKRIYAPAAHDVQVVLPGTPGQVFPKKIKSIFDGDTVHVFAAYKAIPKGDVVLRAELGNGEIMEQTASVVGAGMLQQSKSSIPSTLARLRADKVVKTADAETAAAAAVTYQLMSKYTNYLIVDVREDDKKAKDLPDNVKVPNMLSAGWGGTGKVYFSLKGDFAFSESLNDYCFANSVHADLDAIDDDEISKEFDDYLVETIISGKWVVSLSELEENGLDEYFFEELEKLIENGYTEKDVVVEFIIQYAEIYLTNEMNRFALRPLKRQRKAIHEWNALNEKIAYIFSDRTGS